MKIKWKNPVVMKNSVMSYSHPAKDKNGDTVKFCIVFNKITKNTLLYKLGTPNDTLLATRKTGKMEEDRRYLKNFVTGMED